MRGVAIAHLTAILVIRAIANIVVARFDRPVPTRNVQLQRGILRGICQRPQAGDGGYRFFALLAGFQIGEVTVDAHDLCRPAEPQLFRIDWKGP